MIEVGELMRTERLALIDLLETLAPEQWATPSLCTGWTVQDVAAHLAWAPVQPPLDAVSSLVRARLSVNRLIADSTRRWSARGPAAIVAQLRTVAATGARPIGTPEIAALTDAAVHALDVRRPLGRPRPLPPEVFRRTADFCASARWPVTIVLGGSVRGRIAGVRLVATDTGWSYGRGPEVHGSSDSLLLLLTGRPVGGEDLTGPGATRVLARL